MLLLGCFELLAIVNLLQIVPLEEKQVFFISFYD
jgi:hypothetical protein